MVRSILFGGREILKIHEAAYLLAAFALLSQVLALVRDRLFAAEFGTSYTLDIYYAAFRIPDLLFATVASLLSLYALLPVLSSLMTEREGYIVSFIRQSLVVFFGVMAAVAAVLFVVAPALVVFIAPGLSHEASAHADMVLLIRILLLQPILLGASNILAALVQLKNRFFLYAVSPVLYNLGIIFGITVLYPIVGIVGLGWGVVIGAALHMGIQLPFFFMQVSESLPPRRMRVELARTLKLSVPRTLALASGQFILLAFIAVASVLSQGSISVFMFAWNLQAVPLTIIGVSYSVAAFPTLSRLYSAGEKQEFIHQIEVALRHVLFWAIPITVLVIVLRAQIVRVILGSGAFDWDATRLVAAALALFVASLCAQSISLLVARAYYAAGKTMMPLVLSAVGVGVSIVSAALLIALFHENTFIRLFLEELLRVSDIAGTTVLMLSLAYCIGACVQAVLGVWVLTREFSVSLVAFRRLMFQSFAAGVLGGTCAYGALAFMGELVDIDTALGILVQGFVGGIVGLIVTALVLHLLKNEELAEAIGIFKRRFKDSPQVALEPTDVS